MRAVIQRVREASVTVNADTVAQIGQGLLVLIGFHKDDTGKDCERFLHKVTHLRVFPDEEGRMDQSVRDIDGEILLVPQFTLYGDTAKGHRPSFVEAANPARGRQLFEKLCACAKFADVPIKYGVFQADMQVSLINDGPVTIIIENLL